MGFDGRRNEVRPAWKLPWRLTSLMRSLNWTALVARGYLPESGSFRKHGGPCSRTEGQWTATSTKLSRPPGPRRALGRASRGSFQTRVRTAAHWTSVDVEEVPQVSRGSQSQFDACMHQKESAFGHVHPKERKCEWAARRPFSLPYDRSPVH